MSVLVAWAEPCRHCGGEPDITLHDDGSVATYYHRCPNPPPGPRDFPRRFPKGREWPDGRRPR